MTVKAKQIKDYYFDTQPHENELLGILSEVKIKLKENKGVLDNRELRYILNRHPQNGTSIFKRSQLVVGYFELVRKNKFAQDAKVLNAIRMKPIRTQSGVTPVTVLTKPFPCPGKCIFCPNDVRMPKSYLADEPGAQRAERNQFDPYLQTFNRLLAFQNTGHSVEKIELIILGGTWSFYPEYYQVWFIKRCFDAMNDFGIRDGRNNVKTQNKFKEAKHPGGRGDKRATYNKLVMKVAGGKVDDFFNETEKATWNELELSQKKNESAKCRNVGLVIETRPDSIDEKEVIKIRRLGGTKVQIGIQSLSDEVMKKNKRGHGQAETISAISLLRMAGFKIHAHWMPNLYGATVKSDIADYEKLWQPNYSPDELKIYPTSVIANTELNDLLEQGKHKPYGFSELLEVLTTVMPQTPRYARITRVIRDIPSTDIVAGNKLTNFRQIAEKKIAEMEKNLSDIRGREVKNQKIGFADLELETIKYKTAVSTEYFLSYKTKKDDKIAGFLRLSLPQKKLSQENFMSELKNCAMIREVHVYGQVVGLGKKSVGKAQHLGLGTKLMAEADKIAKKSGWKKMAVISAIGTREYYRKRKFIDKNLYLIKDLV